jgi:hypothetical protein
MPDLDDLAADLSESFQELCRLSGAGERLDREGALPPRQRDPAPLGEAASSHSLPALSGAAVSIES